MSISRTCKYLFILTVLVVCKPVRVLAQATDTTATDTTHKAPKKDLAGHQLCIGVGLVLPVLNYLVTDKYGYDFEADYYVHNEFYLTCEAGWGGSNVNYSNLQYSSKNTFTTLGFNKCILPRDNPKDWDMMFIGLRAGVANVSRSAATYTVVDSVWGNYSGQSAAQNFLAIWAGLTGGVRVELVKGLFAGWNGSARFIMNGKSFNDLAPLFIAGYGRGDKNVAFDFNVYLSYGIRWARKKNGAMGQSLDGATPDNTAKHGQGG